MTWSGKDVASGSEVVREVTPRGAIPQGKAYTQTGADTVRQREWSKRNIAVFIASSILAVALSTSHLGAFEAPGTLDPGFGQGGWAAVTFDSAPWLGAYGDRVVVAPDGRILLCGTAWQSGGYYKDFAFARLWPDGALDPTFDVDGRFTAGFDLGGAEDDELYACDVAPGGGVVAVGRAAHSYAYWSAAGMRLRAGPGATWELDPTFAGDGRLVWDLRGGYDLYSHAVDLFVRKDGSVVAAGNRSSAGDQRGHPWVSRLLPASADDISALDESFGDQGLFFLLEEGLFGTAKGVSCAVAGKVTAGGGGSTDSGARGPLAFRLTESGAADPSFGEGGWRVVDMPNHRPRERNAVLSGLEGATFLIGDAALIGETLTGIFVVKLEADGELDPGYGEAGLAFISPSQLGGNGAWAKGAVLQGDGRIVVGGYYFLQSGGAEFLAVRLSKDGSLDPTFGLGGIARIPNGPPGIGEPLNGAAGIAMQPDGRLVLVGTCWREEPGDTVYAMCASRLQNDYVFADGFEDGTLAAWSAVGP
jgi:uncharacterized delta-60 repeat protein